MLPQPNRQAGGQKQNQLKTNEKKPRKNLGTHPLLGTTVGEHGATYGGRSAGSHHQGSTRSSARLRRCTPSGSPALCAAKPSCLLRVTEWGRYLCILPLSPRGYPAAVPPLAKVLAEVMRQTPRSDTSQILIACWPLLVQPPQSWPACLWWLYTIPPTPSITVVGWEVTGLSFTPLEHHCPVPAAGIIP